MANTVQAIFDTIAAAVTNFTTLITSSINNIVAIFYNATTHEFSFLGILLLIGVGTALVWALVRLIRGSISLGTR